jgi:hypothetical protein
MKKLFVLVLLLLSVGCLKSTVQAQTAQEKEAARIATREKLRTLLQNSGAKKGIGINFRQSERQPFNFVGLLKEGLTYADSYEVVVGVSTDETIGFRIYPRYRGAFININKAKEPSALMQQLLLLNNKNFLFWGRDDSGDVFAGYTFTLESGFPDRSIEIVLYSIRPLDKYVGDMRPNIDGAVAASN